jgi:hypothetical protein
MAQRRIIMNVTIFLIALAIAGFVEKEGYPTTAYAIIFTAFAELFKVAYWDNSPRLRSFCSAWRKYFFG